MVRHGLLPYRVIGQVGYAQTELLRDKAARSWGLLPILDQLRKRDACRRSASCSATPN
jgi:hypothetical protein